MPKIVSSSVTRTHFHVWDEEETFCGKRGPYPESTIDFNLSHRLCNQSKNVPSLRFWFKSPRIATFSTYNFPLELTLTLIFFWTFILVNSLFHSVIINRDILFAFNLTKKEFKWISWWFHHHRHRCCLCSLKDYSLFCIVSFLIGRKFIV